MTDIRQALAKAGYDFTPVIELLTQELYKLGGKLFAEEMKRQLRQHMAESGDARIQHQLKIDEFTRKIFDSAFLPQTNDEKLFNTYLAAMGVLSGVHTLADLLEEISNDTDRI